MVWRKGWARQYSCSSRLMRWSRTSGATLIMCLILSACTPVTLNKDRAVAHG